MSYPEKQLALLDQSLMGKENFDSMLLKNGNTGLTAGEIQILQINMGKMCNQVCKHCHVDAGPDRKEIMTKKTMKACLDFIDRSVVRTVDLTGGAPELNPQFFWFIEELGKRELKIMVRCNLTIINSNPKFHILPNLFKKHKVEVVSSLPHFSKIRTDSQRGEGVFERSIDALRRLNDVGYGIKGTGLELNLVYNPTGAFLPANQESLQREFKEKLNSRFGIEFNHLYSITNMPISRFLEYLEKSGNLEEYLDTLIESFNPTTLGSLMCLDTLSVGWDGQIYDCDFNQMLDLNSDLKSGRHISSIEVEELKGRRIRTANHCFGCTAGSGSSCGGSIA